MGREREIETARERTTSGLVTCAGVYSRPCPKVGAQVSVAHGRLSVLTRTNPLVSVPLGASTGSGTPATRNMNGIKLARSRSRVSLRHERALGMEAPWLPVGVGATRPYLQLQGQGFLVQKPLILNQPVIFLLGFAFGF